jgi:hypothetical protein
MPQTILNYKRKSVAGFSTSGIIIKLIGSCFLIINAWVSGGTSPPRRLSSVLPTSSR